MAPSFTIRSARAEDLPLLGPLEQRAAERFRDSSHPYAVDLPSFALAELEQLHRAGTVWVAVVAGDEPIGFAIAGRLGLDPYLHELDVEPCFARLGVGRALIRRVAEWARACGDSSLVLSTFRDVPWNAPYYERLGFAVVPEREYSAEMAELHAREGQSMRPDCRVILKAPLARLLELPAV